jgi:hypothetical protein
MEADVLRSMMKREKMKDRKRTGARMVRVRRDSRDSWWGVEGRGEEGTEADLVGIVKVSCADADVDTYWCSRLRSGNDLVDMISCLNAQVKWMAYPVDPVMSAV